MAKVVLAGPPAGRDPDGELRIGVPPPPPKPLGCRDRRLPAASPRPDAGPPAATSCQYRQPSRPLPTQGEHPGRGEAQGGLGPLADPGGDERPWSARRRLLTATARLTRPNAASSHSPYQQAGRAGCSPNGEAGGLSGRSSQQQLAGGEQDTPGPARQLRAAAARAASSGSRPAGRLGPRCDQVRGRRRGRPVYNGCPAVRGTARTVNPSAEQPAGRCGSQRGTQCGTPPAPSWIAAVRRSAGWAGDSMVGPPCDSFLSPFR
jgi:hypothetical protein